MAVTDTDPGFDTLAFAKKLKAAGVGEKQAEADAEAVRDRQAGPATRADIATLRTDTRADLAALEARLEAKIERSANRTLLAVLALNVILFAAMTLLQAAP